MTVDDSSRSSERRGRTLLYTLGLLAVFTSLVLISFRLSGDIGTAYLYFGVISLPVLVGLFYRFDESVRHRSWPRRHRFLYFVLVMLASLVAFLLFTYLFVLALSR